MAITVEGFFETISTNFPGTIPIMNFWDEGNDLPYLRMAGLAEYANELFVKKKITDYKQFIDFIESKIDNAEDELYNMIGVSFVEDLIWNFAKENKSLIIATLPPKMMMMYESLKPLFGE